METKPVLQDISGKRLSRGSSKAQDARLDIRPRGFWEQQRSAFFDVGLCDPNAEYYKDREPQQINHMHENERKRIPEEFSTLSMEHLRLGVYNN